MLSIHDIGETVVGDMFTFAKTIAHAELEKEAARKIIPNGLHGYYKEMEEQKTLDAKFAQVIDSVAPILNEMMIPQLTRDRLKYHKFNVSMFISKRRTRFEWDSVLLEIFDYLMDKYKKIEEGK